MAPSMSIAAAQAPLNTNGRPTMRPVIPAIPLHYIKKQPQKPFTIAPLPAQTTARQVSSDKASSPAATIDASSTPPTTSYSTSSDDATDDATSAEEEPKVEQETAAAPHAVEERDSEDTLVDEKEEGETGQEHAAAADDSDKSSTLSNESRPAFMEPVSSSLDMGPAFLPLLQKLQAQQLDAQQDDSSMQVQPDESACLSSPGANIQSPMHHAHPSIGMRNIQDAPDHFRSQNSSPLLGPQFQHPPEGPISYANTNGYAQPVPNFFTRGGGPPPLGFFQPQDPRLGLRHPALTSPDGYSPSVTPGMSEQHPFQSYPSSVQNEFEGNGHGPYNHPNAPAVPNGINGHAAPMHVNQLHQMNRSRNASQTMSNGGHVSHRVMIPPPIHSGPINDNLDGLVDYLLRQFNNREVADYILELHYIDNRDEPVRIAGHNLLLARSPVLRHLMATPTPQLTLDGLKRVLRLDTADRFVTSEGFYTAVSRLYGQQLLDETGTLTRCPRPFDEAATLAQRFDLAIGYAASGHLLGIPPVVDRGVMVATHLIGWETVEKALSFGIESGLDFRFTGVHEPYEPIYGQFAGELTKVALNFVIQHLPADFNLITSVPEFTYNSRLPLTVQPRIQFGDTAFPDDDYTEHGNGPSRSFILSKILIGLPFHLLKYIMEYPGDTPVERLATSRLGLKVMPAIIEEREKRRLKVLNSPIPNSIRLECPRRTQWESVGWRETFIMTYHPSHSSQEPSISRTWVGFTSPTKENSN